VAAPDDPATTHQHRANRDAVLAQAALGFLACMNSSAVIRSQHKRVEPARARRSAAATALLVVLLPLRRSETTRNNDMAFRQH
jgi:hypothetical protein